MGQNFTAVDTPSKSRITEGISGLERVCDNNIEAKGCIVSDENFRTGRRARKVHGEGGAYCFTSKCTPHSWGATRTFWSPRVGGAAAEGP
jgi:hypothetical protein